MSSSAALAAASAMLLTLNGWRTRFMMSATDRRASRSQEGSRDELEHIIRAVAEHDRRHIDAVTRGERLLQLEAVAVGIARDIGERGVDRRARARADAAWILVGGELDDLRLL